MEIKFNEIQNIVTCVKQRGERKISEWKIYDSVSTYNDDDQIVCKAPCQLNHNRFFTHFR